MPINMKAMMRLWLEEEEEDMCDIHDLFFSAVLRSTAGMLFFHIFPSFFITCSPLPHLYSDKFYLCLPSCGFFYFLPLFFSLQYYYCYYYYYSVTCRSFVFFSTDDRRTDPLQMLSRKLLDSFLCFGNKTQGNEHEGSSSFVGPSFLLFLLLLLLFCAAVGSRV